MARIPLRTSPSVSADRLAQPEGHWRPFDPSGGFGRAFRRLDARGAAP